MLDFELSSPKNFKLHLDASTKIASLISLIDALNNIAPKEIELDEDTKIICKLYKILYGENPNFTDKDINIKIKTMTLLILSFYGIALNDKFELISYQEKTVPMSQKLTTKLNKLISLGKIEIEEDYLEELPKNLTNFLIAINQTITEYTTKINEYALDKETELDTLIKFSNIFYANNCSLRKPSTTKITQLAKETSYPIEEIKNIFEKVKKNKRNFNNRS